MNRQHLLASLLLACLIPWQANAALFEDSEARRSILDLRARVNDKADKTALLELARQNDALRQELAALRGQVEVLTNELHILQQNQREFYGDLDNRLGRFEPQQVTIDGKSAVIQPDERNAFSKAEAAFNSGEYKEAIAGYGAFLKRYPKSALAVLAQFGLGNAYFLQQDYKNALSAHAVMLKRYPESEKAPDAMLVMASSHVGQKDLWAAKKTLTDLIARFPESEAASEARERLAQME